MGPGDVFALLIVVAIPTLLMVYVFKRWFALREKQLEVDARLTAEKAAQYAASNTELEQRVRVLEQIVTDGGAQTAAQIEALRGDRRLKHAEPLPTSAVK
jgi:ABC-type phosphate transport system auxiliary subunit